MSTLARNRLLWITAVFMDRREGKQRAIQGADCEWYP